MKNKKIFFLIVLFTVLYIYTTNIDKIPEKIVLFENEDYLINHLKGIDIKGNSISTVDKLFNKLSKVESDTTGNVNLKLSALGGVFKKDIEVSVLPARKVIIGGDAVGIRLYSKGVLVIGESPVQGVDGNYYEPYKTTNIQKGDKILKIDGKEVETILELTEVVSNVKTDKIISIQYEQDGNIYEEQIKPIKSLDDGRNKIGFWVRDGAMGVGTLTFYDISTGKICALGHGISDVDLKELIDVDNGLLNLASVVDVTKGYKGAPGELKGLLDDSVKIGKIELNNECGIYGTYDINSEFFRERNEVIVASKNEIDLGKASIYCTIEPNGEPKEYEIEILKISDMFGSKSKGMIIKVTDEELLEKTGGIIQGMSGSPIIQNGKFIGAVTHVYVNDPTRGYAIFGETMIEQINGMGVNEV